eukprot:918222_1
MAFTFTRVDKILLRLLFAILVSSLAFNVFLHSRISTSLPSLSIDHSMFIRQREMLRSIDHPHQEGNRNLQEELSCGTESTWYEYGCVFRPAELLSESVKQWQSDILIQSGGGGTDEGRANNNNEDMDKFDSLYGNSDMAGFTQQGKDHAINQDRGLIISPFVITTTVHKTFSESSQQANSKTHEKTNDFLMGIFDGHGTLGHDVAQFLQDNFPLRLHQKLALLTSKSGGRDKIDDEAIRKALHDTFIEMDTELPPISGNDGGSTASVILRLGSKLYFANAGDSLSFLASFHDSKDGKDANIKNEMKASIVHRNRYDKAYLPEEKERITKLGGKIFIPPHPEFSRVNAFYPQKREVMSLAMSRSIGDWPHGKIGVIPDPIIDIVNLEELTTSASVNVNVDAPLDFFVVTSSDGLYDHRQAQFVADRLAESYSENNLEGGSDAIKDQYRRYPIIRQCANIIHLATPQNPNRYRDDITLMSLRIKN